MQWLSCQTRQTAPSANFDLRVNCNYLWMHERKYRRGIVTSCHALSIIFSFRVIFSCAYNWTINWSLLRFNCTDIISTESCFEKKKVFRGMFHKQQDGNEANDVTVYQGFHTFSKTIFQYPFNIKLKNCSTITSSIFQKIYSWNTMQ